MKIILVYLVLQFITTLSFCQNNGEILSDIIDIENSLSDVYISTTKNDPYKKYTNNSTIFYIPKPIKSKDYYAKNEIMNHVISRKTDFAILSKSRIYAITSGTLITQKELKITYHRYLTIWKFYKNNSWQIELNAINPQPKLLTDKKPQFLEPIENKNNFYNSLIDKRLGEELIFETDLSLSKELDLKGNRVFKKFYGDNIHLFLPNKVPIFGKENVLNKITGINLLYNSNPIKAIRDPIGDIAYTTGTATIGQDSYNYIRVWQKDKEMRWNIIIDMYVNQKE
mgnify:FL=1